MSIYLAIPLAVIVSFIAVMIGFVILYRLVVRFLIWLDDRCWLVR